MACGTPAVSPGCTAHAKSLPTNVRWTMSKPVSSAATRRSMSRSLAWSTRCERCLHLPERRRAFIRRYQIRIAFIPLSYYFLGRSCGKHHVNNHDEQARMDCAVCDSLVVAARRPASRYGGVNVEELGLAPSFRADVFRKALGNGKQSRLIAFMGRGPLRAL